MSDETSGERIIESAGQLEAVHRDLAIRGRDDAVTVRLRLRQELTASRDELWACCTRADRLAQWFGTVSGELHLGGRFAVEDNASGTVERCVEPGAGGDGEVQLSWEFGADVSQVVVRVGEATTPGASLWSLEHRGTLPQEFWHTYGPGAGGVGWDLALLGLAHHLRTRSTVPPEQSLWVTTPAAAEFIAGSSQAWARASVTAGTREDLAMAAARRTTSFYTTPDAPNADPKE